MTYLTNLKEFGVKATVLASSLALIACGGGGGGYYGDDNKNTGGTGGGTDGNGSTTDPKKVVESLGLSIQNSEAKPIEVAYDNSKILISVQALNRDKGGVADKLINLSIADNENLGVTSKSSQVTTGDNGIAVFELNIPTISAASGKVQLTATVDGTTIKQIYTLNIKKTSTIQSEYNLKIQQGVMLNLPKGTASITAQVTDKNGGVKPNQTVSLVLPVEMQGKFSIATGSSLITDSSGNAIFTIVANSDLTAEDITKLASTSANLDFKLVDEFKAESQAKASITFKDITQVVQKLEIVTEDNPIIAQGGTTKVIVVAKNSDGNLLTNKKVKLSFTDSSAVYGVTIDQPEVITDAKGYATFTLKSASSYPIALSQQGINLKAVYSESADIFATSTVKVTTADTGASNQLGLQRLEIASSYQINAKNDSITITVKGINNKGEAATQGKVKLSLNAEATSNGVTFDGSAEQEFKTGYVTYTLKTNAKTPAAVAALVAAGITATFTADNNISNNIKIAVEDEAQSEEPLSFLAIDPINTAYDYTKDQTIVVKVKATGVKGGALKGETINLGFSKSYSVSELQNLGLSLTSSADALTDATGYATFTYSYKASGSSAQKALVENGLGLIAKPANGTGAASTANLNFKAPTAQGEIDLDHLNVGIPAGSVILGINEEHNISVSVDAMGTDGKVLPNQKVSIGLNDAAISNGVSFGADTTSTMVTNSEGKTIFNLRIKASNTTELANLVSNGLTIAIKGQRKDGSAYTVTRKIEIAQPVVLIPDLAALSLNYDVQTVSVLGGEVRVKVIAKDENGVTIPNTPVAIALSSLAGSRVSLSDTTVTTNSKGEAQFTLKVSEGLYDANLIKNGITFAVVGTNLNNGDRIQQTGTIQVAIPQDSVNLRLTADKKELEFGKSYQVQVAVKDELGANTGYPVNLVLNKEAYDAGIRLSNDSLVTAANGQTPITITIPKDIPSAAKQALINLGSKAIQIKGTIKNPKGVDVISTLEFSVFEAVNPNHLTIASSKASLSVTGDKTIVTVQLLDNNGLPVRDEDVSLAANNSATLIIGTPGDGHPTNTSKPQTVKTDSNGNAFFSVEVDGNTADADLLLSSGVELTASNTNANGALSTQIYRLTAFKPSPTAPQAARYNLRIESNKATLNVRNDLANVTVTLVDQNGGGVANKYISLSIKDFIRNGAIIVGASGLTTDQNGQAVFKVKIDESARSPSYTAAAFDADDLNLAASFSETGYLDATQISRIDVVQSVVQNPIASIVIGVNPTETGSSNDGVYYTKNLSVSVVDFDGKPLANQKVEMDINPTNYIKGRYVWALAPVPGSNPVLKWVGPGDNYYLDNPNNYIDSTGTVMNNNGTPADTSDDFSVSPVVNPSRGCAVSSPYNAITNSEVTSIPVKVPTFLGQGATATYTTDADGKFDFVIRYPKIYAQWLSVQIGASSQVATLPFRTTYNLGLASVASDYSTNGTFGPNLKSPYGINTITCP